MQVNMAKYKQTVNLHKEHLGPSLLFQVFFMFEYFQNNKIGRERSLIFSEHTEDESNILLNKSHLIIKYSNYKSNICANLSVTPSRQFQIVLSSLKQDLYQICVYFLER